MLYNNASPISCFRLYAGAHRARNSEVTLDPDLRRFKRRTLEIAKRRILRREPATVLSAAYGVNLQRIYTIETQVTAAWQELHLPAGWSEVTLVAPKPLIA